MDCSASMVVYCGAYRDTEVTVDVIVLPCGAGEITCLECGGDGDWTKFLPYVPDEPMPCVDCKGTGKMLVSV